MAEFFDDNLNDVSRCRLKVNGRCTIKPNGLWARLTKSNVCSWYTDGYCTDFVRPRSVVATDEKIAELRQAVYSSIANSRANGDKWAIVRNVDERVYVELETELKTAGLEVMYCNGARMVTVYLGGQSSSVSMTGSSTQVHVD